MNKSLMAGVAALPLLLGSVPAANAAMHDRARLTTDAARSLVQPIR